MDVKGIVILCRNGVLGWLRMKCMVSLLIFFIDLISLFMFIVLK